MNAFIKLLTSKIPEVVRENKIIVGNSASPERQDKKTWKAAN